MSRSDWIKSAPTSATSEKANTSLFPFLVKLLHGDDLSMKALSGGFRDRAEAVFAAGVDLALHCNGDLAEAAEVAAGTPELAGKAAERAAKALKRIAEQRIAFDPVDARAKLDAALATQT